MKPTAIKNKHKTEDVRNSFICHANLISAVNHCINSNERMNVKVDRERERKKVRKRI